MNDRQLRVGIGRHYGSSLPWYVTIYNRALTEDRAQGWFRTHAEALDYANKWLPEWKRRYAK